MPAGRMVHGKGLQVEQVANARNWSGKRWQSRRDAVQGSVRLQQQLRQQQLAACSTVVGTFTQNRRWRSWGNPGAPVLLLAPTRCRCIKRGYLRGRAGMNKWRRTQPQLQQGSTAGLQPELQQG